MDVGIIVAHPDDEILWSGGVILQNPKWNFHIYTICRGSDTDRSPKFYKVLNILNASGKMADLDDGPDQYPLENKIVATTILELVDKQVFDLVITHGPIGEYTYHLRHVEVSNAVVDLWKSRKLKTSELWLFAYEDRGGTILPREIKEAHIKFLLPHNIWQKKKYIIQKIYGFSKESWESRVTPKVEAFWDFKSIDELNNWDYYKMK